MNAPDPSQWRLALEHFDALVEASPAGREAALAALALASPALAAKVRGLLDADGGLDTGTPDDPPQPVEVEWPRVPGFRVLGLLGSGGMGDVFLAEREGQDFVQRVALKRMHLGGRDPGLRERFLRERRILAQLNHPNIARLLDGGLDADGNPYFAMEWVEGVDLIVYAREHGLDLRERLRLFVVVCEAVAHAQSNLVVHRDLKPSNVLVDQAGQVKLLDFGIAKLLASGDELATATLAMTPAYAAPEQLLGEPISAATDVYALGAMLHQLLVGRLPERSWRERMRDAVTEQDAIERPSESVLRESAGAGAVDIADRRQRRRLADQLRGDLDQIVLTALRRDPARRYATAQALADDLERHLRGRPVRALPDQWSYRLGKFARRNAWPLAALLLTFAGLLAASIVSVGFARGERAARAAADAERGKAQLQAERATRTKDFVVALFTDVNPLNAAAGKGKEYTAVELLDAAARRVDEQLGEVPQAQAELRLALSDGLRALGRPRDALPLLDAGIPQIRAMHGDVDRDRILSGALQSRAQIREEIADLDGAQEDATEALRIAMALPDDKETHIGRIGIRTTLAKLLNLRNRTEESLAQYEAILVDRTALLGPDDPGLAVDLHNLATMYSQVERHDEAEASARRAIRLFEAANGPEHPRMVWLHSGLGHALLGLHRLEPAELELRTALALALAKLDPQHPVLISINSGLGRVARERGDFAAADAAFGEAVRIATAINHTSLAGAEIHYGLSLLDQGRDADAERLLRMGVERSASLGSDFPDPLALQGTVARGVALVRLGRAEEGRALAGAALERLGVAVGKKSARYVASERMLVSAMAGG